MTWLIRLIRLIKPNGPDKPYKPDGQGLLTGFLLFNYQIFRMS